jgi:hypothetical protein
MVGLRNLASSESLPGVCPDRRRQGALDAEHRGVGSYETRPLPRRPGLVGGRAALATALAADRGRLGCDRCRRVASYPKRFDESVPAAGHAPCPWPSFAAGRSAGPRSGRHPGRHPRRRR